MGRDSDQDAGKLTAQLTMPACRRCRKIRYCAILPEGTRSGNGELQKGQPGIVLLAARSGLPILPAVIWGQENFWYNLRRFKRTELFIRVGEPFKLKTGDVSFDRETRQRMVDEVMFRMAELMPEKYRGEYTDFSRSDTSLWAPFSFKSF